MASDRSSPPSALLLLPPPPSDSFDQFKKAYEPILSTVYPKLLQNVNGTNRIAYLDIALSLPGLQSPACQPPTRVFASLQRIVEHIYRLIGIVCSEKNIEMEGPGGIDSRVILLDFDSVRTKSKESPPILQNGPIIDLQTLASSRRLWDTVYYPDSSVGHDLATAFSSIYTINKDPNGGHPQPIPGLPSWTSLESQLLFPDNTAESVSHDSVIVGGTFDHFHIGHKLLLTAVALALQPVETANASSARFITIGVTGDEMLKNKKYAQFMESWDDRCRSTGAFLTAIMDFAPPAASPPRIERISKPGPNGKGILMKVRPGITLKFVQISDPFGPTITEENLSALIVSKETRSGGAAVNQEREKRGWKPLKVYEVDVLQTGDVPPGDSDDFASKISSTDIRRRRMELAMI